MGYLLIDAEVLRSKGLENFEKMPDGRGIVDFSMLRVLGDLSDVEVVSTSKEMSARIEAQKASGLYDQPEPLPGEDPGNPDAGIMPDLPGEPGADGTETAPADPPAEQPEDQPAGQQTEAPSEPSVDSPSETPGGEAPEQPSAPSEEQPQASAGEQPAENSEPIVEPDKKGKQK